MEIKDIQNSTHFWGTIENELCVFIKDDEGCIYVCGGWECPIREEEIVFVSIIERPNMEIKLLYIR